MPPNSGKQRLKSTIGIKDSSFRDSGEKNLEKWLIYKKTADGAEDLWRIHDNLYDFTDFIKKHPGGQFWLEATKGTDITEAFESHHISTTPEGMLKRFYIRQAKTPRSSPYTFKDEGFYRTLKREVREALKTIPKDVYKTTNLIIDCVMTATFIFSVLACTFWSYSLGFVAGVLCGMTVVAAHSYAHQKDNFRMYYLDIMMFASRAFRIVHILSHHMFPNTVTDLQAIVVEPLFSYYPEKKSWIVKYASAIYLPIIWPTVFFQSTILRLAKSVTNPEDSQPIGKDSLLPLLLPLVMYISGGQPLLSTLGMWLLILSIGSTFFSIIAFTMGHYHPDILIDGDTPRHEDEMDWGITQLDTVCDRYEVTGNRFIVLVGFGDHGLHHLFPTFDPGVLDLLKPVIERIVKQFNLKIRMMTMASTYPGYLKRVAKEEPNRNPPDIHKEIL